MQYATTIERIEPSGLSKTEYRYWMRDNVQMELDWIIHSSRPTKRHGWRKVKCWSRLYTRDSNMQREEPPQDVKEEVRKRVNDALLFC